MGKGHEHGGDQFSQRWRVDEDKGGIQKLVAAEVVITAALPAAALEERSCWQLTRRGTLSPPPGLLVRVLPWRTRQQDQAYQGTDKCVVSQTFVLRTTATTSAAQEEE